MRRLNTVAQELQNPTMVESTASFSTAGHAEQTAVLKRLQVEWLVVTSTPQEQQPLSSARRLSPKGVSGASRSPIIYIGI
jgi:hypothetical protein